MSDYDIWVDFNTVGENSHTVSLVKFASCEIRFNDVVLAGDDDGNTCPATILEIRPSGVVILKLDRFKFKPGPNGIKGVSKPAEGKSAHVVASKERA